MTLLLQVDDLPSSSSSHKKTKAERKRRWIRSKTSKDTIRQHFFNTFGNGKKLYLRKTRPAWINSLRGATQEEKAQGADLVINIFAHPKGSELDVIKPFVVRIAFAETKVLYHKYKKQFEITTPRKRNQHQWAYVIYVTDKDTGQVLVEKLEHLMNEVEADRNLIRQH